MTSACNFRSFGQNAQWRGSGRTHARGIWFSWTLMIVKAARLGYEPEGRLRCSMDSLGIYISVPFCRSKCTYCNFASGVFPPELHEPYVKRLCGEITRIRGTIAKLGAFLPETVDSVYWGGGTPSVLGGRLLREVWAALRGEFKVADGAEITMECAPGLLEESALGAMLKGGLNRVSFGVQSFVDRETAASGRLHTRKTALDEVERIRGEGISNISIDLIAGLPCQTADSWLESLDVLMGTGASHASIYMLEIDEESRLGREAIAGGGRYHAQEIPSDDQIAEFYETAVARLEGSGLRRYEISNFARQGSESRHNSKYWRRQPYLGFGMDAHSMLRTPDGAALRLRTEDRLQPYLAGAAGDPAANEHSVDALSGEQEFSETWFLGLRMRKGVDWGELGEKFGSERVESSRPLIEELRADGLVEEEGGRVRLTARGVLLSNEVFVRFV